MKSIKLVLFLVSLVITNFAQISDECNTKIKEQFIVEAQKLKLELNIKKMVIFSSDKSKFIFAPVIEDEKIRKINNEKGAVFSFMYVESTDKLLIPNGYYKLHLSVKTLNTTQNNKKPSQSKYLVTFIDSKNRNIRQIPFNYNSTSNSSTNIVRPTAGWCGTTPPEPCLIFPLFTSHTDILRWLLFGDLLLDV